MRILTGIQASGELHFGNYFGAMRPMIELSRQADQTFVFVADLHALTSHPDPQQLKHYTNEMVLDWLAWGLDPEQVVFWRQSDVPEHTQLAWILSSQIGVGHLQRAHSYKDKVAKGIEPNAALLTYPVLQAADILLYHPTHVPVGKDQEQHLEMTRDIALSFNSRYGENLFTIPETYTSLQTKRMQGLDGHKMSKSYGNTIPLNATPSQLKKLIMAIPTDSAGVDEPKPAARDTLLCHLAEFFMAEGEFEDYCLRLEQGGFGYGDAKKSLLQAIETLRMPALERRSQLAQNPDLVNDILSDGQQKASAIAKQTYITAARAVGIT